MIAVDWNKTLFWTCNWRWQWAQQWNSFISKLKKAQCESSHLMAHWACRDSKWSLSTTAHNFIQTSIRSKNQKPDPRFGSIYSRHDDNTEIQPVPRISQEGELAYAETSSQDFDEGLKGVDSGKCVPVEKQRWLSIQTFPLSPHVTCVSMLLLDLLKRLCPFRRLDLCHKCTVGDDGAHDHKTEQRAGGGQGSRLFKSHIWKKNKLQRADPQK